MHVCFFRPSSCGTAGQQKLCKIWNLGALPIPRNYNYVLKRMKVLLSGITTCVPDKLLADCAYGRNADSDRFVWRRCSDSTSCSAYKQGEGVNSTASKLQLTRQDRTIGFLRYRRDNVLHPATFSAKDNLNLRDAEEEDIVKRMSCRATEAKHFFFSVATTCWSMTKVYKQN